MSFFITVIDFLALLVWVRIWSRPASEFTFNPLLSGTARFTDRILSPFGALRLGLVPTALLVLAVLLALKCVAALRFGLTAPVLALPFAFPPPVTDTGARELLRPVLFTLSSTFAGLVGLWSAWALTTAFASRVRKPGRAAEAFAYYARPFSFVPGFLRLPVLLLCGALAVALLVRTGGAPLVPPELSRRFAELQSSLGAQQVFTLPSASILMEGGFLRRSAADLVAGIPLCAAGIGFLIHAIIFLVVGRVFGSLFCNPRWSDLMGELIDAIEGRFARRLVRGSVDWTPLAFFFLLLVLAWLAGLAVFLALGRF